MNESGPGPLQPSPEDAIRVDSMVVRYGRKIAVDGLSLTVPRGCTYALLGRNGAGKSSLVRCLLGQRRADRGRASILGLDAWSARHRIMARVGVVAEVPDAPPNMNARQLGKFCSRLREAWDRAAYESRLDRFQIPAAVVYSKLSKGQQRLVSLALALSGRNDLLILDDPTLGLDVVARRMIFDELIADLADNGTTVFLTTHDLDGIESIADRIGILKDGRLLCDLPAEALKERYCRPLYAGGDRSRAVRAFTDAQAIEVREMPWGVEAIGDRDRFIDLELPNLETASLSLEETFRLMVEGSIGGPR